MENYGGKGVLLAAASVAAWLPGSVGAKPAGFFMTPAVAGGAKTNTLALQINGPETATWAMMSLGFAALGFAGFHSAHSARAIPV